MLIIYILIVITLITILTFSLCFLFCLSCLGLTSKISSFLRATLSKSYDRQFIQNNTNNIHTINTQCFICLQPINKQIVATCGHSYCGQCITSYIQAKNSAIQCPACRQPICVLFRKFNPVTQQQHKIQRKVCEYNYLHSKQPNLLRSVLQINTMLRQLPRLFTPEGLVYLLSSPRLKTVIMMAIYAVSPVDLLPEAVLGPVGLVDDGVVLMGIVRQVSGILVGYVSQEGRRGGNRNN